MISTLILTAACALLMEDTPRVAPVAVGQAPNSSTFRNKIYFAGQPSEADFALYAKLGVTKVINLRMPAEMEKAGFDEAAAVKAARMEYVSVPFGPEPPTEGDLKKIFAGIAGSGGDAKVLLHCASSNRVGFVWALYRGAEQGVPVDEAMAEGEAAGLKNPNLKKLARQKLEK